MLLPLDRQHLTLQVEPLMISSPARHKTKNTDSQKKAEKDQELSQKLVCAFCAFLWLHLLIGWSWAS
jgi:hypothetical protein